MGHFELVKRNIGVEHFDLVNFLQERSPLTPMSGDLLIRMETFDLDALRDCIIYNIYRQGLALKTETSRKIVEFLEGDFSDLTKKVYLQVLVHYTKMDIAEIYASYSAQYSKSEMPSNKKKSIDEYFDSKIVAFVLKAMAQTQTMYEVVEIPEEMKDEILKALLTQPVFSAFQVCLDDVFTSESTEECSFEWLKNQISKMQIYITVTTFVPLKGLRGTCLFDGILLCLGELDPRPEVHKADIITLAAHECGNYLARCKFSNFNFSSPFSYLPKMCEKRSDLVSLENNLEIGRCVELLLFDGIQPLWSKSSDKAAEKFFDLLWSSNTYPVIPKAQHESLNLNARFAPSSYFGIDTAEYDIFC